jgi:RimJ/RimL family protein N-acetyltransferase
MGTAIGSGHAAGWLVTLDGRIIGDCGTHGPADASGTVEIGYGLAAPYRGQGLGTEVVAAISDWLLSRPGVAKVRAAIVPTNVASRRVLEKCGFERVTSRDGEDVYELPAENRRDG